MVARVHAGLVRATTRVSLLCESDGRVIWVSPSLGPLLGLRPEALLGTVVATGSPSGTVALILGGDGRPHRVEVTTTDLRADPSVRGVLVEWVLRPDTRLFGRDPVTGLFTLARLVERVSELVGPDELDVAVIRLRSDAELSEDALRHAAQRLIQARRAGELAGRLSDGDLVVVCTGTGTIAGGLRVAQRFRSNINGPVRIATGIVNIRLSAGVATGAASTLDTILRDSQRDLDRAAAT